MRSHIELDNSSSDSSDDEEEEQYVFVPVPDVDRFATDDDDLFMRSVLENYLRPLTKKEKEEEEKTGVPKVNTVSKAEATACAKEVLCTHKKICGADLDAYLATYFAKAWGHFDVNQTGSFEAIKMPQFIRFLASDKYFQFIQPK